MSRQKSPLKARTINLTGSSMRKQLGKRQFQKRKSSLFGATSGNNDFKEPPRKRLFDMYDDSFDSSFGDSYSSNNNFFGALKSSTSPVKTFVLSLPIDLRLATKIRVVSGRPFPFSHSTDANTSSPVSFDSSVLDDSCRLLAQVDLNEIQSSPKFKSFCPLAILKAAGLYYQYPDLCYMQMFPRLDGIARSKGVRASLLSFGNEVVDAVQAEWNHSFEHLYESWMTGQRTSFYVCGPHFTILFIKTPKRAPTGFDFEETCTGLSDFWEHRVIVTPTGCGLRKLLKNKGINFVLPVSARRLSRDGCNDSCASLNDSTYYSDSLDMLSNPNSVPPRREGTPEKENNPSAATCFPDSTEVYVSPLKLGEDIEQDDWLRDIGYSPSKIKSTAADSQDQFAAEDTVNSVMASSAGTTIAFVEVKAIEAFKNLMLDMNLGWAKTGQQAGLPPTLLATEPFMNSALKSLNFNTQVLQKPEGTQYTLSVDNGPILPHVPQMLHEFFRSCGDQLDDQNLLKFHTNGRSAYNGFNEATAEICKNLNEFTFDGAKSRYFY